MDIQYSNMLSTIAQNKENFCSPNNGVIQATETIAHVLQYIGSILNFVQTLAKYCM